MIRILHGADLHLDSPFSSLPPEEAAYSRQLQRQIPQMLAKLGNEKNCQIMLLAGDIFDSEEVHPKTLQALYNGLAQFRGKVFIAPGNHDPYTDISVWAQAEWPDNVHIFTKNQECVVLEELGCRVHGGAFFRDVCNEPLPRVERQGYIELGVFHGDCTTDSDYRPITASQIEGSGLDYLALGHIHKRSIPKKQGKTWYGWPGAAMGRGFDETGLCGVFLIDMEEDCCRGEFLPLPLPRYEIITAVPGCAPQLPEDAGNCRVRMRLVGQCEAPDVPRLFKEYEKQVLSLQIVDETQPVEDLWDSCGDGSLRGLALDAIRGCDDPELAALAAKYLLCALEGRDAP